MRIYTRYSLIAIMVFVSMGNTDCPPRRIENPDPAPVTPEQKDTDEANKAAKEKQKDLEEANRKKLGEVRASVQNAKDENEKAPKSDQQILIRGELGTADQKLADVPPDPVFRASLQEKENLVKDGKLKELQMLYDKEVQSAKEQVAKIKLLEDERDRAVKAADEARAREKAAIEKYVEEAQKTAKAHKEKLEALEKEQNQKTQFWLTMSCYGLAVLCLIAAGLIGYLSIQAGAVGLGSLKRVSLPVMFSLLFFGLGWLTTKPWFWWACGITFGLALLAFIILVVIDARKAGSTAQEKTKIQQVGDDLVTAINDIREVLKNPPMELVSKIMGARTVEEATATIQTAVKGLVDGKLKEYVTEADGTAAYVDSRRRKLGLVP